MGSYPDGASPYGVHDMAGNVWEWTSTTFQPYPYQASDGREDLNKQTLKIARGGSWGDGPENVRAASRAGQYPTVPNDLLGVRLVWGEWRASSPTSLFRLPKRAGKSPI